VTSLDGGEGVARAGGGGAAAVWSVTVDHCDVSRMRSVRKGRVVSLDARAWPAAELLEEP
jgi:hypothetical protein